MNIPREIFSVTSVAITNESLDITHTEMTLLRDLEDRVTSGRLAYNVEELQVLQQLNTKFNIPLVHCLTFNTTNIVRSFARNNITNQKIIRRYLYNISQNEPEVFCQIGIFELNYLYNVSAICVNDGRIMQEYMNMGDVRTVKWLLKRGFVFNGNVSTAIIRGRWQIFEHFSFAKTAVKEHDICAAIARGNWMIFKQFMCVGNINTIINTAVQNNQHKFIKWLIIKGCKISLTSCYYAAKCGRYRIFKKLITNCSEFNNEILVNISNASNDEQIKKYARLFARQPNPFPSC